MKIVIDIPDDDYKFIKDLYFYNSGRRSGKTIERNVINAIKNGTPYEERPKGEWIVGEYMDCHSDILPEYTCPFCGEVAYRKYDFCHCGADMRGGRK